MATTTRKYVRILPAQWAEIEALWQSGEVTLADLSERFGASPRALQLHFAKAGISRGEKAAALVASVREEVLAETLAAPELLKARAKNIRERAYRHAETIEDLVMAQLEAARKDPSQVLRSGAALKMLSLASASLERLHDLKKRAVGLDVAAPPSEDLPQLVVRVMSDEQIKTMVAEQRKGEDGGNELVFEVEPDAANM